MGELFFSIKESKGTPVYQAIDKIRR